MAALDAIAPPWKATLDLEFASRPPATILAARRQEGPLVLQKPLYPEGEQVCHAIVLHPPGGIAGGDELELRCAVGKGAHALLTTPGAARWYRSRGQRAKQTLFFQIDGALEWLPRETIVFDGARATLESRIHLGAEARFIGWEVLCLGRRAYGERFEGGEIALQTRLYTNGRPLWHERGRIDAGGRLMQSPAGLAGRSVCGTFVAAGGVDGALLNACRQSAGARVALTLLPDVLLGRYLGDCSEEAMRAFSQLWSVLRGPMLAREAVEPRIWRT